MVNLVKIVFLTSAFSSLRQEVQIRIQFSSLQFSSCRFLSNSYSKFFSTTKSGLRPLFIVSKKRNQKHFLLNSYSKFLLWTSYRVLFSKNSTEKVFSISYSPIRRRKLHQILRRFSVFFSEKENVWRRRFWLHFKRWRIWNVHDVHGDVDGVQQPQDGTEHGQAAAEGACFSSSK